MGDGIGAHMGWDSLKDEVDHATLAENWKSIDAHDGSSHFPAMPHSIPSTLNQLAQDIHANSQAKGFYEPIDIRTLESALKLLLVVGEVSEAIEALRDGNPEHEAEEVADVFIRLLDYCAWKGFDIDYEITKKHEYNKTRPHKHGKEF